AADYGARQVCRFGIIAPESLQFVRVLLRMAESSISHVPPSRLVRLTLSQRPYCLMTVEGDQAAVLARHDGYGRAHQGAVGQQEGIVIRSVDRCVTESHASYVAGELIGVNPVADL